ncbi:MAG: nodulation protein NfeD [Woeseiaceae bacterium]|nr:nodulation protein NfeD [Woeseiaceae bacterium]
MNARTLLAVIARFPRRLGAGAGLALLVLLGSATAAAQSADKALLMDLKGALGVPTAEFIIDGIDRANDEGAGLVIIRMDTPGGLVEPMRDIVSAILGSNVPVATYVSPGGARADSAGTYILLASHVAAMAPTTHLGAATPVSLTGSDPGGEPGFDPMPRAPAEPPAENDDDAAGDDTAAEEPTTDDESEAQDSSPPQAPSSAMERKVLNDAIAYIRGLAELHGRNADWAEEAVRDAATLTATEALERNVIDLIANNEQELLAAIDGREVKINNAPASLATAELAIEELEPSWRIKFLSAIANPQVALLLLLVGVYGLLFEGYNPGAIVPGVVGVVCLLLAAYALQVLPVNYVGLALILVGLLLIVAEAFVPSFGALGLGGIVAFIVGSIIMFDSGIPGFGISVTFVVTFAVISGLALLWLVTYLVKLRRRGAVSGRESIVGGIGRAMDDFTGEGRVWLEGEAWHAHSALPIRKDEDVLVIGMDGLTLIVKPAPAPDAPVATQ